MPKQNIEHLTKKQFKVKITNIKNLQKMGGIMMTRKEIIVL